MNYGMRFMTLYRDQDHPHGKEMQKSKMLSGEALQIAVKRREAKSQGEKDQDNPQEKEMQKSKMAV